MTTLQNNTEILNSSEILNNTEMPNNIDTLNNTQTLNDTDSASINLSATRATSGPLQYPLFTALWIASSISYIGSWIHIIAASWLMTLLTTSPLLVAAITTMANLPYFLFVVPAGVYADRHDRPRYLFIIQSGLLLTATALAILVHWHLITPLLLLILTLLLNTLAAMNSPAWQIALSDLVPRKDLAAAITLNSLSFNAARAIGPALGGIIIAWLGMSAPFILDAISYLSVLLVLYYWSCRSTTTVNIKESYWPAIKTGFIFAWQDRPFRVLLIYAAMTYFATSALWTLIPLVARFHLHTTALGYGIVYGFLGLGAVVSGMVLLRFRSRWSAQEIICVASILYTFAMLGLAYVPDIIFACCCTFIAGFAWLSMASSFNIKTQLSVPPHLKARAYSIYLMVFCGGVTCGSLVWGHIAEHVSLIISLQLASVCLLMCVLFNLRNLRKQ